VTLEVILLGLASTVRPTSMAAVCALLATAAPRRLMVVYVCAGMAFTIGVGVIVVVALSGVDIQRGGDHAKGIAEIVGGWALLLLAVLIATRRIPVGGSGDAPDLLGRWQPLLDRRITLRTAAIAGPATHVPGLFYLIALNVIVAGNPAAADALLELLLYNVLWFAVPLAALIVSVARPDLARSLLDGVQKWAWQHSRGILLALSLVIGAGLIVRGALLL
jgi:hypothetical protein